MKKIRNYYLVICMITVLLFAGCTDTSSDLQGQETEASVETESSQVAAPSQETSVENTATLDYYEVEDSLSKNCYQAYRSYVSKLKITEWVGYYLVDFDGDNTDELIAALQDAESLKKGKQRYYVMDWEGSKISMTELDPSTEIDGKPLHKLEYNDRDFILLILRAEGQDYLEGVTKKEKDFFHLVVDCIWIDEGWADETQEQRDKVKDYIVLSDLGERADWNYFSYGRYTLLQYKMRTNEVIAFYKDVFGIEREYATGDEAPEEVGVLSLPDGYLYGYNGVGWGDYSVITGVERSASELLIKALIWNAYTGNCMAEMTVSMAANDGKYGYSVQGYEVARDGGFDPRSGRKLEEFQADQVEIQYIMDENRHTEGLTPVIRNVRFMENNEEQFTADAKELLAELKKEYEANPGKDGSNIAAKSTLLAQYEFAEKSKILIYEDAVYGKVPPETGEGAEYGYYLNYCVVTPGDRIKYGEIFSYKESFGDMPANRHGRSSCRHYFLGSDLDGNPTIDTFAYVTQMGDSAEEFLFYAEVGRNHDMTMDEEGWERYDEDFYVYDAYFRPDGTRVLNQFDTWQIATWEYVSNGAFIKMPKGDPLFEQRCGEEDAGFYVKGKKLNLKAKSEGTVENFLNIKLDAKTKLVGQINYWEWQNKVSIDLVFNVDGTEVRLPLWDYMTYWE